MLALEGSSHPKTPVSYTHLDVYKRQGWGLSTLVERFNMFTKEPIEILKKETMFSVSLPLLAEE